MLGLFLGLLMLAAVSLGAVVTFGLESLMYIAAFIVFSAIMFPLLVGIAWKNGYLKTLFFTIEDGSIGFVDKGETNVHTYLNWPGKVLRWGVEVDGVVINDWSIVDEEYTGQSEDEKTWIQRRFGQYWIGFAFLGRKIHMIPLTKKKTNATLRPNMPPEEWVTGSNEVVRVKQLRCKFPRPVPVPDMKFSDAIEGNLLLFGNYEIVVPRRAVYLQKGDFFDVVVSYTMTAMKDVGKQMTSETFRQSDQAAGSTMSQNIVRIINQKLIVECGVRLKDASIPVYNLSSDEEEKAAKAAELARQQGLALIARKKAEAEGAIIDANAAAEVKKIDAAAEAEADTLRNGASITDVTLAAERLIELGVHPDIAGQVSGGVGRATRYSDPQSPVATQVEGNNMPLAIPIERRVVLADR